MKPQMIKVIVILLLALPVTMRAQIELHLDFLFEQYTNSNNIYDFCQTQHFPRTYKITGGVPPHTVEIDWNCLEENYNKAGLYTINYTVKDATGETISGNYKIRLHSNKFNLADKYPYYLTPSTEQFEVKVKTDIDLTTLEYFYTLDSYSSDHIPSSDYENNLFSFLIDPSKYSIGKHNLKVFLNTKNGCGSLSVNYEFAITEDPSSEIAQINGYPQSEIYLDVNEPYYIELNIEGETQYPVKWQGKTEYFEDSTTNSVLFKSATPGLYYYYLSFGNIGPSDMPEGIVRFVVTQNNSSNWQPIPKNISLQSEKHVLAKKTSLKVEGNGVIGDAENWYFSPSIAGPGTHKLHYTNLTPPSCIDEWDYEVNVVDSSKITPPEMKLIPIDYVQYKTDDDEYTIMNHLVLSKEYIIEGGAAPHKVNINWGCLKESDNANGTYRVYYTIEDTNGKMEKSYFTVLVEECRVLFKEHYPYYITHNFDDYEIQLRSPVGLENATYTYTTDNTTSIEKNASDFPNGEFSLPIKPADYEKGKHMVTIEINRPNPYPTIKLEYNFEIVDDINTAEPVLIRNKYGTTYYNDEGDWYTYLASNETIEFHLAVEGNTDGVILKMTEYKDNTYPETTVDINSPLLFTPKDENTTAVMFTLLDESHQQVAEQYFMMHVSEPFAEIKPTLPNHAFDTDGNIEIGSTYLYSVSGNGVIEENNTYYFSPTVAGTGTHELTITAQSDNCQAQWSHPITVERKVAPLVFSLDGISDGDIFCQGTESINKSYTITGGTEPYSVDIDWGGIEPSGNEPGQYIISYAYNDINKVLYTGTITVTILPNQIDFADEYPSMMLNNNPAINIATISNITDANKKYNYIFKNEEAILETSSQNNDDFLFQIVPSELAIGDYSLSIQVETETCLSNELVYNFSITEEQYSISGTVNDAECVVVALQKNGVNYTEVSQTVTDENNEFILEDLPVGKYIIKAIPKADYAFITTYYHFSPNIEEAEVFNLIGNITSVDINLIENETATQEVNTTEVFTVYPNPLQKNNTLTIKTETECKVIIRNAQGKTVLSSIVNGKREIPELFFSKGIYFISFMKAGKEVAVQTIIVK